MGPVAVLDWPPWPLGLEGSHRTPGGADEAGVFLVAEDTAQGPSPLPEAGVRRERAAPITRRRRPPSRGLRPTTSILPIQWLDLSSRAMRARARFLFSPVPLGR